MASAGAGAGAGSGGSVSQAHRGRTQRAANIEAMASLEEKASCVQRATFSYLSSVMRKANTPVTAAAADTTPADASTRAIKTPPPKEQLQPEDLGGPLKDMRAEPLVHTFQGLFAASVEKTDGKPAMFGTIFRTAGCGLLAFSGILAALQVCTAHTTTSPRPAKPTAFTMF